MGKLWHYKRDGRECGPVTASDLKLLADAHRLLPMDLVRKDGSSRWAPARSVRGLFEGEKPSCAARLIAWWGPTGLFATFAAVLIATVGVVILLFALRGSAAPAPPAAAVPAPTPAPAVAETAVGPPAATPLPRAAGGDAALHRRLVDELRELREARAEMHGDGRDFGGHPEAPLPAASQPRGPEAPPPGGPPRPPFAPPPVPY